MLDSRKLFIAFVLLVLGIGSASAQIFSPLGCVAQAAGTPSIRAEGVTELVGDVLIICNGGTPTALDAQLPQVNIQIFSSPSINVTSRILSSGTLNNMTEALLFIDEPTPAIQTICGSPNAPYSIPIGSGQQIITGVCGNHLGTGTGTGTYAGGTRLVSGTTFTPLENTYQARQQSANSLIWQGVPFDPPGTIQSRVLRITNVRVNASQLGVPAGSQASVSLVISTSASGVLNPIALPITNPAPTVAIAQNSLTFSVVDAQTCLQCESGNKAFSADPAAALTTKGTKCDGQFNLLRYQEIFPTVFRRRSVAPLSSDPPASQDVLGVIYQTESGFYRATLPVGGSASNWPTTIPGGPGSAVSTVLGQVNGTLGLADHGTRLIARFTNIPNGIQLWLAVSANISSPQAPAGNITGTVRMVTTDPNGAGPFSPTPQGSNNLGGIAQISIIGGSGQAVYEVLSTDTTAIERVEIPTVVAYTANTTANLPSLGTASVNGNLAPISTVSGASTSAPLPRFVDTSANRTYLTINSCRTNILFPFVSNQAGFDTGLAISNTSKDPFGTALQTGACTVNFYGTIGTSKVCLSYPSPSITGGEHFVWSLANGGAVTATAGFQGYVIAQCAFQYGHGFAFISDLGAQRLAMGYLALIMDTALASRTGSVSESLGH